jgi:hypothetical protein
MSASWDGRERKIDSSSRMLVGAGYDLLLTNDSAQLADVDECRAIKDSGLHHVRYHQNTKRGIDGLALAMAAVLAAIRPIVGELETADGQRLVEIQSIAPGPRHRTTDPRRGPPPYWPSRAGRPRGRGAG